MFEIAAARPHAVIMFVFVGIVSVRSVSALFRQIEFGSEAEKADGLFRAAISGFCSLTRPTRREIAQLDDLAQPLFDSVSVEARRFAAAALSECASAPPELVRRLCNQPTEVAAPLLVRSVVLRDIDLIALIGRHGIGHARAIQRRSPLNPAIGRLISALIAHADRERGSTPSVRPRGAAEEEARTRLRGMMRPADNGPHDSLVTPGPDAGSYATLQRTALAGKKALFQTALADALGIAFGEARRLTESDTPNDLLTALRALDLETEQAFLLAALAMPGAFTDTATIRDFVRHFQTLEKASAVTTVRGWNPRFRMPAEPAGEPDPDCSGQDNAETARGARLMAS